ncbi:MAG TPA: hypothetical protein VEW28_02725 [Candidatus Kapabacteria bacterium]|nr:hypothetical protein [Candidatus Kapabacteria bacterium]
MSQKIFQLVDSLSADELKKIKAIRATGKQGLVLGFVLEHYRSDPGKASEENFLPSVSREHFYEICSVMLERCYAALVPEGGISLIDFLGAKQLPVLVREEVRRQENSYISTLTPRERADHYYGAWMVASRFDSHLVDEPLLDHCAKEFIAASTDHKCAKLLMNIMTVPFQMRIKADDVVDRSLVTRGMFEKLLHLETEVGRYGDDRCRFHLALAWATFKQYETTGLDMVELRLAQASEYIGSLNETVHRSERDLMRLRIAVVFAERKEYAKAYSEFLKVYEKHSADSPVGRLTYYRIRMAECALMIGKYDDVNIILDRYANYLYHIQPTHDAVQAAIVRGLSAIFSGDLDRALHQSELAHVQNGGRNYTFELDLHCRYLECATHLLRGEYDLVRAVIVRSIQLLRTKDLPLKKYAGGYYYLVLEAFMQQKLQHKRVKDKRAQYYKLFAETQGGPFGKLLEFVREKMKVTFTD